MPSPGLQVSALLQELRVRQWVKNTLLLVPLLLAHEVAQLDKLLSGLVACLAFSFCASAVYVVNDLHDLEADRHHPQKRYRPFAAGTLPLQVGSPLALGLVLIGFSLTVIFLSWQFFAVLVLYLILTTAYSYGLKRIALVDMLLLAGLYTLRLVAGGLATTVPVSEWLMSFSVFFFVSIAAAKRYAELSRLNTEGKESAEGRGYMVDDLSFVETSGLTSGYLAVLVFALYLNSEVTKQLYPRHWMLWMLCPLLYYWVGRVWLLAKRRQLSEDPVVFATTDPASLVVGVLTVLLVVLATGVL
ncbi:MAG: UbiA family prenyltransferase [Deltaproteobacteria bacterium]|nr:UbiA family prenyltransferase [Deltaproteobacteria bacterium]